MQAHHYEVKKEANQIPTWVVFKHTGHDMAIIQARFYNEDNATAFCNALNAKLRGDRLVIVVHKHQGDIVGAWVNKDAEVLVFDTYADIDGDEETNLMDAIEQHGKQELF